jgi:DNA repair photolyase
MPEEYQYSEEFNLLTQLKSWIAVNPSFGCVWDCAYCIQQKDRFFNQEAQKRVSKAKFNGREYSPEDVVSELMVNPRVTSESPLVFYNFSDPFLPQNTADLVRTLKEMDSRKFTNPLGLITRTYVGDEVLDDLASLDNLRKVVLVSYAGYNDKRIESAPNKKRVTLIRKLREREIPVLLYLRPVVQEWTEEDQFLRLRDEVGEFLSGVIMSGLRLTPEIIAKIEERGLEVPSVPNHTNKFLPKDLQQEIEGIFRGVTPVYRYTSCGISATLDVPDYNDHLGFFRKVENLETICDCKLPCKEGQVKKCLNRKKPEEKRVRALLNRIGLSDMGFEIKESGVIFVERPISNEDRTFIRHNTSCHVDFKGKTHYVDSGKIGDNNGIK